MGLLLGRSDRKGRSRPRRLFAPHRRAAAWSSDRRGRCDVAAAFPLLYASRPKRSRTFFGQGKTDEGIAELQKAVRLRPDFAPCARGPGAGLQSKSN